MTTIGLQTGASTFISTAYSAAPWPYFEDDEIDAAVRVLQSGKINYWTGDEGRHFEREFAEYIGCKHAVAVSNGTVALELALRSLGVGPGDEVITSARTFIASASCAVAVGARAVVADVDRKSQNITKATIAASITPKTKAIVAVHLAGWPCEMDAILDLAREHGLKVVEDCAQAHGAAYRGRRVGSMGDAAAFSFCQDKIMTTSGEGGMVTTNDDEVWSRAWSYKDHGKSYEAVYHRKHGPGFRWLHESFGTNMRLTEVQSAMGRVALRKLPQWVTRRRAYASMLNTLLERVPGLRVTIPPADVRHSYYKYYAFLRPEMLRRHWTRDRVMEDIKKQGIPCFSGSCGEIYLESAFKDDLRPSKRLPVARELGETSLMFLVHPTLTESDIERTAAAVESVLSEAIL